MVADCLKFSYLVNPVYGHAWSPQLTDAQRFAERIQAGRCFFVQLPAGRKTEGSALGGVHLFEVFVTQL